MDVHVRFVSRKWMNAHCSRYTLAFYHPPTRRIRIVSSLKKKPHELIYTLAHELGHAVDFDGMNKKEYKFTCKATALSNLVASGDVLVKKSQLPHIRDFVLDGEKVAFENGDDILRILEIPITKSLRTLKKDTMSAYRRLYSPSRF